LLQRRSDQSAIRARIDSLNFIQADKKGRLFRSETANSAGLGAVGWTPQSCRVEKRVQIRQKTGIWERRVYVMRANTSRPGFHPEDHRYRADQTTEWALTDLSYSKFKSYTAAGIIKTAAPRDSSR
jgi:hypothetical protein